MRAIHTYQRSSLENAPAEDILVLLLEAALKHEANARSAMESGDRTTWIHEVHTARAIFIELRHALDHSLAPEVTANLDRSYRWCIHQLIELARTGDAVRMQQVETVTQVLSDTWTQAVAAARATGNTEDWNAA